MFAWMFASNFCCFRRNERQIAPTHIHASAASLNQSNQHSTLPTRTQGYRMSASFQSQGSAASWRQSILMQNRNEICKMLPTRRWRFLWHGGSLCTNNRETGTHRRPTLMPVISISTCRRLGTIDRCWHTVRVAEKSGDPKPCECKRKNPCLWRSI